MKVLIPIDGSQAALNAVRLVCEHRDNFNELSSVLLMNVAKPLATEVTEDIEQYGPLSDLNHQKLEDYYRSQSDIVFEAAENLLKQSAIDYQKIYDHGVIATKIQQRAEEERVDLIVMGTRGQTAFESLLFGSVMTQVIAITSIPTLVVSHQYSGKQNSHANIAVAMDTLEDVTKPLGYVISHQNVFGPQASYRLVHVEVDHEATTLSQSSEERIEIDRLNWNQKCQHKIDRLECVRLRGEPGMSLVDYCRREKIDLIVMGSHGYGRLRSALIGSFVRRVASLTAIPLLIIR